MTSMSDTNPRPTKRLRTEPPPVLSVIPPPKLLLSIPSLVLHPPTHKRHHQSIALAQHALRQCLALQGLDPVDECRAWTGLAELGLGRLETGIRDVEGEVEKALTKALLIAHKNPALKFYAPHLIILSARLAQHHQNNARFAHHTLRKLIVSFVPARDPPNVVFSAHLALIRGLASEADVFSSNSSLASNSGGVSPALAKCLAAVKDLYQLSVGCSSTKLVALLALVIRVQILIRHGVWGNVAEAVRAAEDAFASYSTTPSSSTPLLPPSSPAAPAPSSPSPSPFAASPSTPSSPEHDPSPVIPPSLHIHLLVLTAVAHTHFGDATAAWERVQALHALADQGALKEGNQRTGGVIQIPFGPTDTSTYTHPLYISGTHPRVLYILTCLVSAAAKRDAVGRKPRKKVFAREGLGVVAAEIGSGNRESPGFGSPSRRDEGTAGTGVNWGVIGGKEVVLPREATLADVASVKKSMVLMKADLLAEIINVCIMRSEFHEAESTLNELTAHLRTHRLFPSYAARITLINAQLAHALGRTDRARKCYEIAGWLAAGGRHEARSRAGGKRKYLVVEEEEQVYERDEWVRVAARAGEVWVRIGVLRMRMADKRGNGGEEGSTSGKGGADGDGDVKMCDVEDEDGDGALLEMAGDEEGEDEKELQELKKMSKEVVEECRGMGGSLSAIGEVICACLCDELLGSKTHLRQALNLATRSGDNHLRALVLALSASHYLQTAPESAVTILGTCEQIASGLGAGDKHRKSGTSGEGGHHVAMEALGNLRMRVWVGERFVELHRSVGDMVKAEKQEGINRVLRTALGKVEVRGLDKGW